ncbi:MAG: signal peptidase I [Candidatus Poribacteria bacterium]|nr:signal peptidase I [Candidatus Poribacteria bacterium]
MKVLQYNQWLCKTILFRIRQYKGIIFTLIFVFGFFRPFIVDAYLIPSGSMEDTLLVGDRVLVCKFMYGFNIPGTELKIFDFHEPAHGDVFIFIPPHQRNHHFIKRVVAVEGDTVYTKGKTLYVNGQNVDEKYTKHLPNNQFRQDFPPFRKPGYLSSDITSSDWRLTEKEFQNKYPEGKPFVVPKGHVFAMGDNRDLSSDSRTWGPVDVDDIKGQAFMVLWSTKYLPVNIWEMWKIVTNIRFNRIGKIIR